jgi:hypothetical protein
MTRNMIHRGSALIAALALALGPAGTALAKPSDDPSSPNVQHPQVQNFDVVDVPTAPQASATGGDSAWPYLAIGGGAIGLVVAGGGAVAVQRRRRQGERPRATIAA